MPRKLNGGKRLDILLIKKKLEEIKFIFNHVSSTVGLDLFEKEEIEDFDKSQYEDSLSDNSSDSDNNSLDSLDNDM